MTPEDRISDAITMAARTIAEALMEAVSAEVARSGTAPVPFPSSGVNALSPWLTAKEAAKYARTSLSDVIDALSTGALVGNQRVTGGKWRIRVEAIDAWIEGIRYVPPAPPAITHARYG